MYQGTNYPGTDNGYPPVNNDTNPNVPPGPPAYNQSPYLNQPASYNQPVSYNQPPAYNQPPGYNQPLGYNQPPPGYNQQHYGDSGSARIIVLEKQGKPCQFCNKTAGCYETRVIGPTALIWGTVLFFLTACCCWIPCVIPECKDREIRCASCLNVQYRFHAESGCF